MDVADLTEADLEAARRKYDALSDGELEQHEVPKKGQTFLIHGRQHYEVRTLGELALPAAGADLSAVEQKLADLLRARGQRLLTAAERPEPVTGDVDGIEEGHHFRSRYEAHMFGVHRPLQAGISGTGGTGAESIVISGGYEDDDDRYTDVIYTGHGGQKDSVQVSPQKWDDPGNAALSTSKERDLPVRVIRGVSKKGKKQRENNPHLPASGYRYDGLYRVVDHWRAPGVRGIPVCQFHLVKLSDAAPPEPPPPADRTPTGNGAPQRRQRTASEIARLARVRHYVVRTYDYTCQACGTRLQIGDRAYAEGAHIRAVGGSDSGPDEVDNMLCLCPNCHVQFDHGALVVEDDRTVVRNGRPEGELRVVDACTPAPEHLRHHRETRRR